jgi:hypothetical protein
MDEIDLKKHFLQLKHFLWQEKHTEEQHWHARIQEVVADKNQDNLFRDDSVSENDKAFCLKYVQTLLACGIPLHKNNGMLRHFIQDISEQTLSYTSHIKKEYLDNILKMGKFFQEQELQGKRVSIITGATPRMGDVFALTRFFLL